jgi:hypothetical protein
MNNAQEVIVGQLVAAVAGASALPLLVIHGSRARGDARLDSDLDLLAWAPDDRAIDFYSINRAAAHATGFEVEVMDGRVAIHSAPTTVFSALTEGVVAVDPDAYWPQLLALRNRIAVGAAQEDISLRGRVHALFARVATRGPTAIVSGTPNALSRKAWRQLDQLSLHLTSLDEAERGVRPRTDEPALGSLGACLERLLRLGFRRLHPHESVPQSVVWEWTLCQREVPRAAFAACERACATARCLQTVDGVSRHNVPLALRTLRSNVGEFLVGLDSLWGQARNDWKGPTVSAQYSMCVDNPREGSSGTSATARSA